MQPRKTIVRSFRLEVDIERALFRAAQDRRISENALLSDIIYHALETDSLDQVFGQISLPKDIFKSLLSYVREDICEIVGFETANRNVQVSFEILKLSNDAFSLYDFIKTVLSDSYHWFNIEVELSEGQILLIHDYGVRWSLFLKGYLACACDMLHLKAEFTFTETLVKLSFAIPNSHEFFNVTHPVTL
jgi:hypothetical protein